MASPSSAVTAAASPSPPRTKAAADGEAASAPVTPAPALAPASVPRGTRRQTFSSGRAGRARHLAQPDSPLVAPTAVRPGAATGPPSRRGSTGHTDAELVVALAAASLQRTVSAPPSPSHCLTGLVCVVDGYAQPVRDELRDIITKRGGAVRDEVGPEVGHATWLERRAYTHGRWFDAVGTAYVRLRTRRRPTT